MQATSRRALPTVLLALGLGCSPHRAAASPPAPPRTDATAAVAAHQPAPATADAGAATVLRRFGGVRLTLAAVQGAATLDTTLRLPSEAAGTTPQDGGVGAAQTGASLLPGDGLVTADGAELTLATAHRDHVVLHGAATVEGAGHTGSSLVLSYGVATLEAAPLSPDGLRVDTPSGRVIVRSGSALVAVSDDGWTFVLADGDGVTLWPGPPAPPAQATRLAPDQIAALRRQTPEHPVLLDVEIRELDAVLRPVASRALHAGERVVLDPLGGNGMIPRPLAAVRDVPATRAPLLRWASTHRPNVIAIGVLSRAGAADVGDVNAALTRLRNSGSALADDTRARVQSQLSLALGRLAARSRRGRDLAVRGGDVTALVQMARFESLRDDAATVAP